LPFFFWCSLGTSVQWCSRPVSASRREKAVSRAPLVLDAVFLVGFQGVVVRLDRLVVRLEGGCVWHGRGLRWRMRMKQF